MRRCVLTVAVLTGLLGAAGGAWAQSNPPFQNPALDSNCYFPQIGDPTEMDTVYGSVALQGLGWTVKNLGPKANGSYGNMLIGNMTSQSNEPDNYTLSQVSTGPGFNLHQMTQSLQKLSSNDADGISYGFVGHFRDRTHTDIFDGQKIFWADDNGNYDSSRFSVLKEDIPSGSFGIGGGPIPPYTTHLTSDTVDDIVVTARTDNINDHDTAYALLYRGGMSLFGKDTVAEDTSAMLYPMTPNSAAFRSCIQADFRGVGRDDLIVFDGTNNLCYYKNDPPFSIQKFAQAVAMDTLLAAWQGPNIYRFGGIQAWFPMSVLPKKKGDHSVDLIIEGAADPDPSSDSLIFVLRGGEDFGSHRLTIDSAAFVFLHPKFGYYWPGGVTDAGDMTGTGKHVLFTGGYYSGGPDADNFYLTGNALDDKIDMYIAENSGGDGDTLTANSDSLEDFLIGMSAEINPQGTARVGALRLIYGSKQIPVRLNPKWADVKNIPTQNGVALSFAPNPIMNAWSVATVVWPESEQAEYKVYDLLGNVVQRGNFRMLGGAEQQRMYFSGLPNGVYIIVIQGLSHEARAKLVIAR